MFLFTRHEQVYGLLNKVGISLYIVLVVFCSWISKTKILPQMCLTSLTLRYLNVKHGFFWTLRQELYDELSKSANTWALCPVVIYSWIIFTFNCKYIYKYQKNKNYYICTNMVQPSCCAQCLMLVYRVSCNCVMLNNN